jgi:hypothetical protein
VRASRWCRSRYASSATHSSYANGSRESGFSKLPAATMPAFVLCRTLQVVCCHMSHAARCLSHCMLPHVATCCHMLHAARCMLHAARCMLRESVDAECPAALPSCRAWAGGCVCLFPRRCRVLVCLFVSALTGRDEVRGEQPSVEQILGRGTVLPRAR